MSILDLIVGSSTPDGLAPISSITLIILTSIFCAFSIVWAILNFLVLIRKKCSDIIEERGIDAGRLIQVVDMAHKVIKASFQFLKFNTVVCFVASIIFFLIILGGIEHFTDPQLSLTFLFGFLNSIFCSSLSSITYAISYSRICGTAQSNINMGYLTAKNVSHFVGFFIPAFTLIIICLITTVGKQPQGKSEIQFHCARLISFGFGASVVSVGTKGIEKAFILMQTSVFKRDGNNKNPILVCKIIGQSLKKSVVNTADSLTYFTTTIAIGLSLSSKIIGVDQQGQIIFQQSINNAYLPILVMGFALFFTLFIGIGCSMALNPTSTDQIRFTFKIQLYSTIVFLIGFYSLAAYLCLPAQFKIVQDDTLKRPYMAYLMLLMGMLVSLILMLFSQFINTSKLTVNQIIKVCGTGAATNLIFGLAFGYFFNFFPIIFLAISIFVSDLVLGAFGVALVALGIATFIPFYLNFNTFYSVSQTASMMAYLNQMSEETVGSILSLSNVKRYFEPHVQTHFNIMTAPLTYASILYFISDSGIQGNTSLTQSPIFGGMLIGSMLAYTLAFNILKSLNKVAPIICLDIQAQLSEQPGIAQGNVQADYERTNNIYLINSILQIRFFIPHFFIPIVITGILLGPQSVVGFMTGLVIGGIQMGLSSNSSGQIWESARSQIFFGLAHDADGNQIRADSQAGTAADIGNSVGSTIKDSVGSSIHIYIVYVATMSCVFGSMYKYIHS